MLAWCTYCLSPGRISTALTHFVCWIGKTENEIPVGIRSLRRQDERLLGLEDQVWLAQPPSLNKFRGLRQIRGSAFCRALLHPGHDAINVGVGQAQLIGKLQLLGLRKPGRHGMRADDVCNLARMLLHIGVIE